MSFTTMLFNLFENNWDPKLENKIEFNFYHNIKKIGKYNITDFYVDKLIITCLKNKFIFVIYFKYPTLEIEDYTEIILDSVKVDYDYKNNVEYITKYSDLIMNIFPEIKCRTSISIY